MKKYFTSESVTSGHPDKVCDLVADAILDDVLANDKTAHTAIEVGATTDFLVVMGEISSSHTPDVEKIARDVIRSIGYTRQDEGFSADTVTVINRLHTQSPDIAQGVNNSIENTLRGEEYDLIGAGDQGMMFGYATNETDEYLPLGFVLSHRLTRRLQEVREKGILPYVRPDGKAQVTVEYDGNTVKRIECVVVSTQHLDEVSTETLRADIRREVIDAVVPGEYVDENTKFFINPTGRFVTGGPHGDSGVTGRKIIVDSYGGYCPHGGGATSGKDPTKVDRSAAYYARYVAKNIVAAGLADVVEIQVAYAIGKAEPVSVMVSTSGTGKYDESLIADAVLKVFDFRPKAIIDRLGLQSPIYKTVTNYGNYGKSYLPWERTDKVEELKRIFNAD